MFLLQDNQPCQIGLVVSVSASHTVGREFASDRVIPKTIIKWYKLPPA